mmetsp:Transcript_16670/g.37686  ORF Transcript_16670/g.37686 Transcript_16670/m.37686 type:complete len:222 (-) Transcript_16670:18-683(-)
MPSLGTDGDVFPWHDNTDRREVKSTSKDICNRVDLTKYRIVTSIKTSFAGTSTKASASGSFSSMPSSSLFPSLPNQWIPPTSVTFTEVKPSPSSPISFAGFQVWRTVTSTSFASRTFSSYFTEASQSFISPSPNLLHLEAKLVPKDPPRSLSVQALNKFKAGPPPSPEVRSWPWHLHLKISPLDSEMPTLICFESTFTHSSESDHECLSSTKSSKASAASS